VSALAFELPPRLEAHEPAEARGLARDDVRLMVASRSAGAFAHARFHELPSFLTAGDVLVINVSATLPAAITARRRDGEQVALHLATAGPQPLGEDWRVLEVRSADGARPRRGVGAGERLALAGGATAEILAPYAGGTRLWLARFAADGSVAEHMGRHGRPIRYGHSAREWPLAAYQTVYAVNPGSAEMPSAGRPFTRELITRLAAGGVILAPITLHAGLSSPERHEPPAPEHYEVPAATAALLNAVRGWGGRIIAVGTTVVRALETVARPDGEIDAGSGWTSLVVDAERGLAAVDGLLTGWHEPQASHLRMLEAAAGEELLGHSYRAALEHGYLWHEFGDSHLILP
jgi:S-adenosylmethionine:tRNA ribosyltransferase-isomerase